MSGPGLEQARALAPRMAQRAADYDRDGSYPAGDLADLRQCGLTGLMGPPRRGGMVLGSGNGASALIFNMHASVTGALAGVPEEVARALGVPESFFAARDRILRAAAGGALYAVAMSERGAGSRLSELTTTYAPVEGGYRIRGAKTFVSGAGHDAVYVARRVPTAMIFTPCKDGLSHNEAESILPEEAEAGCQVLFEAVVARANRSIA